MPDPVTERSYGCSLGCGRPYDFIIIDVQSGTTEFPCVPCYLQLASDMLTAMLEPGNPDVQSALAAIGTVTTVPMDGNGAKRGRRNAPANSEDPDLMEAFDSVITVDELSDEFR